MVSSKAAVEAMAKKLEDRGLARERLFPLSGGPFIEFSQPERNTPRVEIMLLRRR